MIDPLILDYDAAAQRLSMTKQALRDWVSKGRGPKTVKIGRRVFFKPADLEAWIEEFT